MKKEILIVEDDPQMHEIYRDMLDERKFNITSTDDPLKALQLIQWEKKKFDLILLDILMKDKLLDGRVFFIQLREALKDRTPVIIVSVLNEDQVDDLKKINHLSFLAKPIHREELLSEISKKLN